MWFKKDKAPKEPREGRPSYTATVPTRAQQAGLRVEDLPRPSLGQIIRRDKLDAIVRKALGQVLRRRRKRGGPAVPPPLGRKSHPKHLPQGRTRDVEAQAAPVAELHLVLGFLLHDGNVAAVAAAPGAVRRPRLDRRRVRESPVPELVPDAPRGQIRVVGERSRRIRSRNRRLGRCDSA